MKTAADWIDQFNEHPRRLIDHADVEAIQLDAAKWALEQAAILIRDRETLLAKNNAKDLIREHYHMTAILQLRDNLTADQLPK